MAAYDQAGAKLRTQENDPNMKKAADLRAAFDQRQEEAKLDFENEDKRGFLGQLRPGKKPNVLDIIADPDIAFDDRFPKTEAMQQAMGAMSAFKQRTPELGEGTFSGPYGGSIWPISGEIAAASAPALPEKAAEPAAALEGTAEEK